MCGTLKFENRAHLIGNLIPVVNPATLKAGKAVWSGFAQEEKLEWWKRTGNAVPIRISPQSMIEQQIELRLRGSIHAIGLKNQVIVQGRIIGRIGEVKLITRRPISDFEIKVHNRWPVIGLPDGNIQVFNFNDVIDGLTSRYANG